MPVKNAGEFRAEQKNNPRYSEIPVVLMSADANLNEKMQEHGFVYGTKKPFDMDDMLSKIRSLVTWDAR